MFVRHPTSVLEEAVSPPFTCMAEWLACNVCVSVRPGLSVCDHIIEAVLLLTPSIAAAAGGGSIAA